VKLEFPKDTETQRKALKVAVAVVAGLWLVSHFPHHAQVRPVMPEKKEAPLVATPVPAAPVVAAVAPPPPDPMANVAKILGAKWEGSGAVSAQVPPRWCHVYIDVKRQDKDKDAPPFTGYSILACNWKGANASVTSAVLSGVGHDGVYPSIDFSVVSTGGVEESVTKCAMTNLKLEAFGDARATVSWKETGTPVCGGGEMILNWRRMY
jgi:hypothetical protein